MPSSAQPSAPPVRLVCGGDEFAVKQRAREILHGWTVSATGQNGPDLETVDANAANSGEALRALAQLRESLQTLPFFGSGKVVWFRDCNFLGEERTATAKDVTESLASLAAELKQFAWDNVQLLITAGKVDKRKTFYKTIDKIGAVETFDALSVNDRDWAEQAEGWVRKAVRARNKEISHDAVAELISRIGPNARQLDSEIEKVCLYTGDRTEIASGDIAAVCARNKAARAFALGDALGDRDLPRLLKRLDEELWDVKLSSKKSEIGLLYGLIAKIRAMLLLKEMIREGWIKPAMDYQRFKGQLARAPADRLPADDRFNPLSLNPYVLYKALPQVNNYSSAELVRAMELLLRCNQRLVSSGLEESLVLQHALVQIARRNTPTATNTAP